MSQRGFVGASVVGLLLSTTVLQAQITADEVWQNWQELSDSYGQTLTAQSEVRQGDTLVITGLSIEQQEDDVSVSGELDEVRFRDLGNGTVEVTMSPVYPLTITSTNSDGDEVVIDIEITQTNLRMIAGGTPDSTSYDFTSDAVSVAVTSVTEDGVAVPAKFVMAMDAMGGNYGVTRKAGDMMDMTTSLSTGQFTLQASADNLDDNGTFELDLSVAQLAMRSAGTVGAFLAMEELPQALAAGFAADLGLTYGPAAYRMNVTDASGPTNISGKADGGRFGFAMDKARLAYQGGARAVEVLISGAQVPFPEIAVRYAETVFDFLMPISKGPAPQDFRMGVTLRDLTVSDEIWSMFDPTASLPRDPATLVLDARGQVTLTADIMDEAAMNSGQPPGTIESLEIPTLQLKMVGAELTGNGALTFDNTDMVSFDGVPAPTGTINLLLVGGNALLDKLVAMGVVPQEEAMGARMMMGMFARPGDGPDTLTSTLEFKDKGFSANGMRLK